mgnify:CR=1 FL=1
MKTLKITLALVAVLVLTVSGVQSDNVVNSEPTFKENSTHINLLAHKKNKIKAPANG